MREVVLLDLRFREVFFPANLPLSLDFAHPLVELFTLVLRQLSTEAAILNSFEPKVLASFCDARPRAIVFDIVNDKRVKFHFSPPIHQTGSR